jgi:hypothetical protein
MTPLATTSLHRSTKGCFSCCWVTAFSSIVSLTSADSGVGFDLVDTESWTIALPTGVFDQFEGDYFSSVTTSGDASIDFNVTYSLVPTPEPRLSVIPLCLGKLVLRLSLTRERRQDRTVRTLPEIGSAGFWRVES